MTEAAKKAIADLSTLIEQVETAGAEWHVDERLESAEWKGAREIQEEGKLSATARRRISFVVDRLAWGWDDALPIPPSS